MKEHDPRPGSTEGDDPSREDAGPGEDGPGRAPGPGPEAIRDPLTDAVVNLVPRLLEVAEAMRQSARRLDPGLLPALRQGLESFREPLVAAHEALLALSWPEGSRAALAQLDEAARRLRRGLDEIAGAGTGPEAFPAWVRALRARPRALAALYPLADLLSPIDQYFLEERARNPAGGRPRQAHAAVPPGGIPPAGIMHFASGGGACSGDGASPPAPGARGSFTVYVPEHVDPGRPRPLIVALHGGSGNGADFLWTWVREARSRGFIVLAPTATGPTWPLDDPGPEAARLEALVELVVRTWNADPGRVLLTGLSDGATFTLLAGLAPGARWSALAPFCGVLHPANLVNGNMERARGRPIFMVHGALDWMFPIELARIARDQLLASGAVLTWREVRDLSHAYPFELNPVALDWFAGLRTSRGPGP